MKKARLILLVAVMVGLAAVSVWAKPAELDLGGMMPQAGALKIKTPQVAVDAVAPKVQAAANLQTNIPRCGSL